MADIKKEKPPTKKVLVARMREILAEGIEFAEKGDSLHRAAAGWLLQGLLKEYQAATGGRRKR